MTKRVFSIRLPESLAADLEVVARIEGKPMSGFIADAIFAQIEAARADPEFQKRLRDRIEADKRIIERLTEEATNEGRIPTGLGYDVQPLRRHDPRG